MGNKQDELEHCPNFLPGESSKAIIQGEKTLINPGGLLHLRKEGWGLWEPRWSELAGQRTREGRVAEFSLKSLDITHKQVHAYVRAT